jgi:hypothetical protein
VPTTDRHAIDGGDDRLGDVANHLLQVADLEHSRLGRAVVAGLGALLDVASGAEGLVAGAGEHDRPDRRVGPGEAECLDELLDGLGAEGVVALRAVDRDVGTAVRHGIRDVLEVGDRRDHGASSRRQFIE